MGWRCSDGVPARAAHPLAAVVLALASAGLYPVAFPPGERPEVAWIALLPLLLALRGRGPGASAALGMLWGTAATAGVVAWIPATLTGHFEWSQSASLGFLLGVSLVTAAPFVALALACIAPVSSAGPSAGRAWLFAAAWVAGEYLRAQLGLRSPWAQLGSAFYGAPHLRQLVDLTGVYGLSFVCALTNAALAELIGGLRDRRVLGAPGARRRWLALASAPACLVAALGYGAHRLSPERETRDELDLVLVQGNVAPELRWRRSQASYVLRRYGGLTRQALREGDPRGRPDLVVWPENALQTGVDDPAYGGFLRALAGHTPLLVGAPRRESRAGGARSFNSAFLLSRGERVWHYDKRRLLPFSETRPLGDGLALETSGELAASQYSAGLRPGVLALEGHLLGVLICMDALYPEVARDAVREGAELLVNLSNDAWFSSRAGAQQHFSQVVLRAVETRRPVVRVTTSGITAIISPAGEVVSRIPSDQPGTLRGRVALPAGPPSLYARIGDAFAFLCLAVCLSVPCHVGLRALTQIARASRTRRTSSRQIA